MAKRIEEKEWIVTGEFKDLFMLINILNKNQSNFKSEKLWEQIEAVVCHQCFSEQSTSEIESDVLHEIVALYSYEFAKGGSEFITFFRKFFDHFEKNQEVIDKNLSLTALSYIAITYAQYGMTNPADATIWDKIRKGAIRQLTLNNSPLESIEPIQMILNAL